MSNWLLPEYIADVLPSEARKIEELRRKCLDLFRTYGYELVMPPMLEYLESLITQADRELALRTFKLVDQLSGRTMGLRADITPQIARIDAHLLNKEGTTRLCYVGSVLHTKPRGVSFSRENIQMGAEIFGCAHVQADLESQQLIVELLQKVGLKEVRLDLNHAAIFNHLISLDVHAKNNALALQQALARKDQGYVAQLVAHCQTEIKQAFLALPSLYGDMSVLDEAKRYLPASPIIEKAIQELKEMAEFANHTGMTFDLADLRGYRYYNGVMFSAYVFGLPNAIAHGGRYDNLGSVFGRARPATGFSFDLRKLADLTDFHVKSQAILAPWGKQLALKTAIRQLREQGEIVIQMLPNAEQMHDEFYFNRILFLENNQWLIKHIDDEIDLLLKKSPFFYNDR